MKPRDAANPDIWLSRATEAVIRAAGRRARRHPAPDWTPDRPLRLLLAGYNGMRNTGADVRVAEIVRQLQHLFGQSVDLGVLTLDSRLTEGYFEGARQIPFPPIFMKALYDAVAQHDGVIACEGSMFKSTFANALSIFMVGALGTSTAQGGLAVGYGGEAGKMDPFLEDLVRRYCSGALLIMRNRESRTVLSNLGIDSLLGADTAWTFRDPEPELGPRLLKEVGWDGIAPVLIACPVNPFWWPVRPDLPKAMLHAAGLVRDHSHAASIYFHRSGPDVERDFDGYLNEMAKGIRAFADETGAFVVLLGMEKLDRIACERLDDLLGGEPPVFISDRHDMFEMVAILRNAAFILSSRYHALVCSMPAAVPSVGVTFDERIRNLMAERGHEALCLDVRDPSLGDLILARLRKVRDEPAWCREGIGRCVADNLIRMDRMGRNLVDHVRQRHPDLALRPGLAEQTGPLAHLPEFSPALRQLVARHAASVRPGA